MFFKFEIFSDSFTTRSDKVPVVEQQKAPISKINVIEESTSSSVSSASLLKDGEINTNLKDDVRKHVHNAEKHTPLSQIDFNLSSELDGNSEHKDCMNSEQPLIDFRSSADTDTDSEDCSVKNSEQSEKIF